MNSRFLVFIVAALAAVSASAATINLGIGDTTYVGSVNDGIPSSPANEVIYINTLITRPAGSGDLLIGTETYNRMGSTLFAALPISDLTGALKFDSTNVGDATGFEYVLGKYDAAQAGSLVWYLGGIANLDLVSLPLTYNGHGISHLSLYNATGTPPPPPPPPPSVPDGGSTVMLLGIALGAIALARRYVATRR